VGVGGEPRGGEKLGIDVADAQAVQPFSLYQSHDLHGACRRGTGKALQQSDHLAAVAKIAQRKLSDDPLVSQDRPAVEQLCEARAPGSEMVDPDRRIGQDHRIPV